MDNRYSIVSWGTIFISEAILIFLLIVPFMHSYFQWIPYVNYFVIIGLLCLLFSMYTYYSLHLWIFILTGTALFFTFHLLNYPLLVNLFVSFLLTWRYLIIRGQPRDKSMFNHPVITSLLIVLLISITDDHRLLYLIGVQFLLVLISHFFKGFGSLDVKPFLSIFSVLFFGALSFLLLFSPILKLWELVRNTFFLGIGRFVGLFDFVEEHKFQPREPENIAFTEREEEFSKESSILEPLSVFFSGYLGITLFIVIGGMVLFIFLLRKRLGKFSYRKDDMEAPHVSTSKLPLTSKFSLKKMMHKPAHPARKLVYEFEREMLKLKKGRAGSETLESWLNRIGLKTNLAIYQKVRYGEEHISPKEIQELQREIQGLRKTMKKEDKESF